MYILARTCIEEWSASPPVFGVNNEVDKGHEDEGSGRGNEHVGQGPEK